MNKKMTTIILALLAAVGAVAEETTQLPVLRIYFDAIIEADMSYANGKMELTQTDGLVVRMPAKFKTRGATAKEYLMKPSLNMKLRTADYTEEADSALLGMRSCSSWILDAMAIDRICMRNRVAFDIWNAYSRLPYATDFGGRNGTEGRFVELYINDQYYGIYCLSDRINRKLLNLKKVKEYADGSSKIRGVLYKSGTTDISNQNEAGYSEDSAVCVVQWHDAWELTYPDEYGGKVAWEPLQDAILRGMTADYVKKYFFLENLVDYHLHVMALCITDNWGNKNHFLSVRNITKDIDDPDPTEADRRRFVMTPWDLDTSLGGAYNGAYYDGTYDTWPVLDMEKNPPYPINAVIADTEYRDILKKRWVETRKGAFAPDSVNARLEQYRDLFLQSGAWQRMVDQFETMKYKPCYVIDLNLEIALIENWYKARFQEIDKYFGITNGISTVPASERQDDQQLYDLQGRRVDKSHVKPGIYVTGGKIRMMNGRIYE